MFKSSINLNLYKVFYEVAKTGGISAAAKKLFTSQPAISKSIKNLEEELGVQLFYRTLNGTDLTDKGKELLFYVEEAFNNLLTAERNLVETESLDKGKLNIGVPSHIATFFIFENIEKFHRKYPNIEITIISKSTDKLLELLITHQIDFIIDSAPVKTNNSDIIVNTLTEVNNCFVVSKNTKINPSKIRKIKDLKNKQLILPINGTTNRNALNDLFLFHDFEPNNIINIETSEMIISAIKREIGIGYVIQRLVQEDIDKGELILINLEDDLPTTTIELVYIEKYLTKAPLKFLDMFYSIYNF